MCHARWPSAGSGSACSATPNTNAYAHGLTHPAPRTTPHRSVTLGFPAFNNTLFYDPTVAVESSSTLGYTTTAASPQNGAVPARALLHAVLGAAAILAVLLG